MYVDVYVWMDLCLFILSIVDCTADIFISHAKLMHESAPIPMP